MLFLYVDAKHNRGAQLRERLTFVREKSNLGHDYLPLTAFSKKKINFRPSFVLTLVLSLQGLPWTCQINMWPLFFYNLLLCVLFNVLKQCMSIICKAGLYGMCMFALTIVFMYTSHCIFTKEAELSELNDAHLNMF